MKKEENTWKHKYSFIISLFIIIGISISIFGLNISKMEVDFSMDNNTESAITDLKDIVITLDKEKQELQKNITSLEREKNELISRYKELSSICENNLGTPKQVDCWDEDNKILFDCNVEISDWMKPNGDWTQTRTYSFKKIK